MQRILYSLTVTVYFLAYYRPILLGPHSGIEGKAMTAIYDNAQNLGIGVRNHPRSEEK